jgi:hypothetical protein
VTRVGGIDDTIWLRPQSDLKRRPRRQRHLVAIVVLIAIVLVGVGLATLALFSAKDYGTPAFWSMPKHIGYCGREYYDQGTRTGSPRLFTAENGAVGAKWTFLSWTYGGDSIYAAVAPSPSEDTACTTELYIPVTGSTWETYVLSGGT